MDEELFQAIPQEFEKELFSDITKIKNQCLCNIIYNFEFKYLITSKFQDENTFKSFIYEYLTKFNFFTYQISNLNPEINITDLIICVEDHCIIIKSIKNNTIDEILTKFDSKINSSSFEDNEDIDQFCFQFLARITKNELINIIFRTISSYLIRRYSYPKHYFKNPSFFQYKNEKSNFFENNIKEKMTKILCSNKKEELNNLYSELINYVTENKPEKQEKQPIYEFKEDDFFILKKIPKNKSTFYLVIEKNTLHIFMMCDCSNREIEFCEKFSHPYFTRFYGFIKDEKGVIKKIIYEYMSNDNLSEFIEKRKNIIDESYIFLTIYRVFQGIEFLRSNSLVHRDLKPTNILIDHDFIPYIADFEFIRPIDDGNHSTQIDGSIFYASPEIQNYSTISYSTDIYSFGLIIYFLYEKKNMIESVEHLNELFNSKFKKIKMMEKGPENMKKIYYSSVVYNQNERIKNDEIKEILLSEFDSFYYLDKYFIEQNKQKLYSIIVQFIYERMKILDSNKLIEFMNHIREFMLLKFELNNNNINNKSALINIGDVYYYKRNYLKALKYYELASQLNNSDAFLYLADLYYRGNGVTKNLSKAAELYKKSADLNNPKSFFNLGNMYSKGEGVTKDIKKAIEYFKKASKFNIPDALFALGNMYLLGNDVTKNTKKAIEYYELASKLNYPDAIYNLGYIYFNGFQCKIDYKKARECFDKLAELKDSRAFLFLGHFCEFGINEPKDYKKAKEYYQLAANLNNPRAFNNLGYIHYQEKNYKLAKYYFEISAQCGDLISLNNLGYMYMNGIGVGKNYSEAFKYLKIAAQSMNSSPYTNLGVLYFYGLGVKQNYIEAIKCFEIAALDNNQDALLNLGIIYFSGHGVKQNYKKAFQYFEKAANQNNSKALLNLGNMYLHGQGVQQDYILAKDMYERSAKLNDSQALFNLGYLYLNGFGVQKDYHKTYYYFDLSARQGYLTAKLNIGNLYFHGIGVEKNYLKAVEIYKEISDLNDSSALFNLGICYYYGRGVGLDYLNAIKYFNLSSKFNNSWALLYLGICYYKGNGVEPNYIKSNEYFKSSADLNNHWALFYLGKCYFNGFGIAKDFSLAKKYFELSANQNNSYAQFYLGNFYFYGINCEQNFSKAKEYFEMSATQFNVNACLTLACLYLYGYGVKQNFKEAKKIFDLLTRINDSNAFLLMGNYYSMAEKNYTESIKYFKLSAKMNNSCALFNLGCIFLNEQGVKKDYSTALYYFEQSAKLNNSFALLQIGNIYFNGQGVEKDLEKAKYYYERAAELKNSRAILILGILYYYGLGTEKDHLKAKSLFEQATLFNDSSAYFYLGLFYSCDTKNIFNAIQCFELSAKKNNPFSVFLLGYLYSNDNIIEYDFEKAIQYFFQCSKIQHNITLNYFDNKNGVLVSAFDFNHFFYRSSNDLGLIYLIEKNNLEKALEFIKQAAFAEFPFGQNNYGLVLEFYLNNLNEAEHFYDRSSEHKFALAYFNLARLKEKSGKINEAFDLYAKASLYENEPLVFHDFHHYDKRLEISKIFIICYTNLKLSLFYFNQSNFDESKNYFIKAFSKLIIDKKDLKYQFRFRFNNDNSGNIFSYFHDFIFNSPFYNLQNQTKADFDFNNKNDEKNNHDVFEETKSDNKNLFKSHFNPKNKENDSKMTDSKTINGFISEKIKNSMKFNFTSKNFNKEEDEKLDGTDENQIFKDPKKLFEYIISNNNLKNNFINEIKSLLYQIEQILFTSPYNILFGRINIVKPKPKEKINPFMHDINQTFYEGFE